MTKEDYEIQLALFLVSCKQDADFIEIKTYANSVIVTFDRSIHSQYFIDMKNLDLNYFVYRSGISDAPTINLFIYKKKFYDFD